MASTTLPLTFREEETKQLMNYAQAGESASVVGVSARNADSGACVADSGACNADSGARFADAEATDARLPAIRSSVSSCDRSQTLTVQLRKKRREGANYRERRRMRRLNDAFDLLRQRLPHSASFPLSKHETLQMAAEYILALKNLLT